MDLTIEQYLEFVQHLMTQRDEDEETAEKPLDESVYWC